MLHPLLSPQTLAIQHRGQIRPLTDAGCKYCPFPSDMDMNLSALLAHCTAGKQSFVCFSCCKSLILFAVTEAVLETLPLIRDWPVNGRISPHVEAVCIGCSKIHCI